MSSRCVRLRHRATIQRIVGARNVRRHLGTQPKMQAHTGKGAADAGQNVNSEGIRMFLSLLLGGKHRLMLPHADIPDIRWVDWQHLADLGFKGCVFDKDNTLTRPYALDIEPDVAASLKECQRIFGGNVVLFSNSAGLEQYDPDSAEAIRIEAALDVPVLRHKEKKPAGGTTDIEARLGCAPHEMVMLGDRYLTDVFFGNRNGMLSVRVAPFVSSGESVGVRASRYIEETLVSRYRHQSIAPPEHPLVTSTEARLKLVRSPGIW